PLYALVMTWSEGLASVLFSQAVLVTVFGCVLLHELGHALMGRFFGIPTRDITLYPIGGVARLEGMGGTSPEGIATPLAGPAVNLALVLLLSPVVYLTIASGLLQSPLHALAADGGGLLALVASYLSLVCLGNGILLVFNLLPVFPMDGGRVFRSVLSL